MATVTTSMASCTSYAVTAPTNIDKKIKTQPKICAQFEFSNYLNVPCSASVPRVFRINERPPPRYKVCIFRAVRAWTTFKFKFLNHGPDERDLSTMTECLGADDKGMTTMT
jgi:hypothetical protein